MTELKPCPFCGGDGILINSINANGKYSVIACSICGATTKKSFIREKRYADEEATVAWNRRTERSTND